MLLLSLFSMKRWEQPDPACFSSFSALRVKVAAAGQSQKSSVDFQVRFDCSVWGPRGSGYSLKDVGGMLGRGWHCCSFAPAVMEGCKD